MEKDRVSLKPIGPFRFCVCRWIKLTGAEFTEGNNLAIIQYCCGKNRRKEDYEVYSLIKLLIK